jgi:hypothetical protein
LNVKIVDRRIRSATPPAAADVQVVGGEPERLLLEHPPGVQECQQRDRA